MTHRRDFLKQSGAAVAGEDGIVAGIVARGRVVPFSEAMRALQVSVPVDH